MTFESVENMQQQISDHESVDDIVVIVTQRSYGVRSWHSRLRHHQVDVLRRYARLVNLRASPAVIF